MVPTTGASRRLTAAGAKLYLAKASQYLEAAQESLESGWSDAAVSLAVHAGINAADAISGARQGIRSSGPDHSMAIKALGASGREGAEAARYLRKLLPLKTLAEYDAAPISKQRAISALRSAEQIVAIAESVILSL
ncbi:MAG: HEPN domain-containing protein [Actinomycetota bacterium]